MTRKIIEEIHTSSRGRLATYKQFQVGDASWLTFVLFELTTMLLTYLPGAVGLFLRGTCYRPFFKQMGRGVVFGTGVSIRNPGRMVLGNQVVIDDYVVLDAKGDRPEGGIVLSDRVFISRFAVLGCKNGMIRLGANVSVGPHSTIHSVEGSSVTVGDYAVMAAYGYVIGAPDYKTDRTDVPMATQGFEEGQGIDIGRDTWLGAYAAVLDGVAIGEGAIVGAKALVRKDVEPFALVAGVPAATRRIRTHRPDAE